jgi:multicomponent Na+:H+ antiporter subunit F
MTEFLNLSGVVLLLLIVPLLYRGFRGPTTMDRMVAANTIGTKTTVLLLFIGMMFKRLEMFVDFALTYALLNFIGSLTVSWYYQRKRIQCNHSANPSTQTDL